MNPRLKEKYNKDVLPRMMKAFNYKNRMGVPRLEKIVINMGVGEATENAKALDQAASDLTIISGQKPAITRARKSVSGFKLREGVPIGCKVTLRGSRMYEFFDRLVNTEVSVQTAVAVLRWCSALGWHGARRGAHCYNAGPAAAEGTAYTYAKIIATHYAQAIALVRWHKAHIRLAER